MNRFKHARMLAGLKQSELAKALGISTVAVSAWEHGRALPNVKRLGQVAKLLNTTPEKLLEDERAI